MPLDPDDPVFAYDPALLDIAYESAPDEWATLDAATASMACTYEMSEHGVLLIAPTTATVAMSWHGNSVEDPLLLAKRVRVQYNDQPVFLGFVSELSRTYTAQPPRIDLSASAVSAAGEFLATPLTWAALPAEAASDRLARFVTSVDLGGIPDRLMPAEEPGEATLLEVVRAASDAIRCPVEIDAYLGVRAMDDADTVPAALDEIGMAEVLYAAVSHTETAGDRVLSTDVGDRTSSASAVLRADDVRVLVSGFRVPQALPVPFGDPANVASWSVTFTPQHCTATVEFARPTANVVRLRPPVAYRPGGTTTPLTGGTPWDPTLTYPPGAVVTHDGHLWRTPTTTSQEPGAPTYTRVTFDLPTLTLPDSVPDTVPFGLTLQSWEDGAQVTYRLSPHPDYLTGVDSSYPATHVGIWVTMSNGLEYLVGFGLLNLSEYLNHNFVYDTADFDAGTFGDIPPGYYTVRVDVRAQSLDSLGLAGTDHTPDPNWDDPMWTDVDHGVFIATIDHWGHSGAPVSPWIPLS